MVIARVLAVAAVALIGGCSWFTAPEPPAPAPKPPAVEWMLIAPPDDQAAATVMATLERLPTRPDALPATPDPGVPADTWRESTVLVRAIAAQDTPRAGARLLAERSVIAGAPRSQWRQVRPFPSRERCEWTLEELRAITRDQTAKIVYRPGMRLDDLQFLLLASSWRHGDCVRADHLPPARAG